MHSHIRPAAPRQFDIRPRFLQSPIHFPGRRFHSGCQTRPTDGPENVSVIAETAGVYRIDVAPLGGYENASGRYEIKIVELRKATEQELQAGKSQEVLKASGLAL